ncbi:MAG: hypothetical protein R2761_10220 [Acidimicrobiales bacterium]
MSDSGSDDWPARAAALVERSVGSVRDKTTGPVLSLSRYVVYLSAMVLIALVAGVLALILLVRLLVAVTGYVPGIDNGESWLAYLVLGGIFLLVGLFLWRRKEGGDRA